MLTTGVGVFMIKAVQIYSATSIGIAVFKVVKNTLEKKRQIKDEKVL